MDQGDTGSYWVSGKNSIHCDASDQVVCIVHVEGQPKGIHIPLVISRTPQQLAVAGASQSIRDYGVMLSYMNDRVPPATAQAMYPGSRLGVLGQRLYDQGRAKVDNGAAVVVIDGSNRTGAFTIR
jgi:hypothetical protein